MRTLAVFIFALAVTVAVASADDGGFVIDRAQAVPKGQAWAMENGAPVLVDVQPHGSYFVLIELHGAGGAEQKAVFQIHDGQSQTCDLSSTDISNEPGPPHSAAAIRVTDIGPPDPDFTPRQLQPEMAARLATARRFVLQNVQLEVYWPGFDSFTAHVTHELSAPPVLGPPVPGQLPQYPQVLSRPLNTIEDLGWISGSL